MFINYKYLWQRLMNEVKRGDGTIDKYDLLSIMSSLEIRQLDYQRNKLKEVSSLERC